MKCSECCWCTKSETTNTEIVCSNKESENYNKVFTNEVAEQMECEDAETQQAVDYRNMTPWQFASKYYM